MSSSEKIRLDQAMVDRKLADTRSHAETLIQLGKVKVAGVVVTKPAKLVTAETEVTLGSDEQYVSRAGYKLASVAGDFKLNFKDKVVLDVGSSTGGFTDFALQHGAKKVIAVDVGTDQLHKSLHGDKRIELHEKTDIRLIGKLSTPPDIILIDVSFISLRGVLPTVKQLAGTRTRIVAMLKPQFEAGDREKHNGVIKNDTLRRRIIKNFEEWLNREFLVLGKADSAVSGAKGNRERFYLLKSVSSVGR